MPVDLPHETPVQENPPDHRDNDHWIEIDLPYRRVHPIAPPPVLARALNAEPRFTGRCGDDLVVLVDDADTLAMLEPDYRLLRVLPMQSVIVTAAPAKPPCDFVARVFLPGIGAEQDPAAGLALCCLRPFWRARLGRDPMRGIQTSRRGEAVEVRFEGDRTLMSARTVPFPELERAQ